MTGLLVSVRSADEVDAALSGGATLIDVKEPHRGSLGRADREIWQAVVAQVRGRAPVSVACGELVEWDPDSAPQTIPDDMQYAKCGMAGCLNLPAWPRRWHAWRATLPASTRPVAVIYADACRAQAPPAEDVLAVATEGGCRVVLWDTYIKDGTHLLDHVTQHELDAQVRVARYRGMLIVLAGSLTIAQIPPVMRWQPAYLAVRGAVCQPDRTGTICPQRVAHFARALAESARDGAPHGEVSSAVHRLGDPTSVA